MNTPPGLVTLTVGAAVVYAIFFPHSEFTT